MLSARVPGTPLATWTAMKYCIACVSVHACCMHIIIAQICLSCLYRSLKLLTAMSKAMYTYVCQFILLYVSTLLLSA